MPEALNFTKPVLKNLPLPEADKRAVYFDSEKPGLQLRVTSNGAKTFSILRRVKNGEPMRITLGRFPDMTVESARKQFDIVIGEIATGSNPAAVRRTHRGEPTLTAFFKEYGERHGAKKRAWTDDQQRYRDYLKPTLGSRKVSSVKRDMIGRVLSDMERQGKAAATVNNVRALASAIFGKAIEWSYLTENPVKGIKTRKAVKRDRFLQSGELSRFFAAVAQEPNEAMRDFFLIALLTGARRDNVLSMQWVELSLTESLWRIPRTKNGEPQNVTLSPEAVAILQARQEDAENKAMFVFPGEGKTKHLVEPKGAWKRILARAEIENLRIHDLRRTLGSWQAKTGASLAIIGKSLNHKSQQTTAIYARLDLDPVRQSVNLATAAMLEAGGMKAVTDIKPLNAGARRRSA